MAKENDHFVDDGYDRARAAHIDKIQADVEREFADRMASAGWLERWRLRCEIRREVEHRLERVAPPWGLYFAEKE